MTNNHETRKKSPYETRLRKEESISEDEITQRMRWDMPILAQNHKCSISLDLPVMNCRPSDICAQVCYASQGRQMYYRSVLKSLAVNQMIAEDPERAARKMIDEAAGRSIRLAGSGDLLPEHRALTDYISALNGQYWGFTRRVDTHRSLSDLMFSVDASTPDNTLQYVEEAVPVKRRAYLRRPQDAPSPLEVAVTFPVHGPWTNYVPYVPEHGTDCPSVRGQVEGCWYCRRSF